MLPLQRERNSRRLPTHSASSRDRAPGACRRRDLRARAVRPVPASMRQCSNRWRGAGAAGAAPGRAGRRPAGGAGADRATGAADFGELPRDPGVYLFRDPEGRTLYVGKSVSIRSRARAHFAPSTAPADWTPHAIDRRLPLDTFRTRRPGPREPVDQGAPTAGEHSARPVAMTGSSTSAAGSTSRSRSSRSDRTPAAGHAVTIGPLRGRAARARAGGAAQLAVRAAPLRTSAATAGASLGVRADGALPVAVPR